jgi:hypothetical protein
MNLKHYKAVMEVLNCSEGEREERIEHICERDGMTVEELGVAAEELNSGNDVEGAAIGIGALKLTYPDQDADEYLEACDRILDQCCPLMRLQGEPEFPDELEYEVDELIDLIIDGADRIAAGRSLGV